MIGSKKSKVLIFFLLSFSILTSASNNKYLTSASNNKYSYKGERTINLEKYNISRIQKKQAILKAVLVHGWRIDSHTLTQVLVTSHKIKTKKGIGKIKIRIDITKGEIQIIFYRSGRGIKRWLENITKSIVNDLELSHYMKQSRQFEEDVDGL